MIGNTPLIRLSNAFKQLHNIRKNVNIFVKLEYFNPTGSIKDRMVDYVISNMYNNGSIHRNSTILEASSGNTGASVSMVSKQYGLDSLVVTDKKCSTEKQNIIKLFGSELIVTDSGLAPNDENHYQNIVQSMHRNAPHKYTLIDQYNNLLNAEAYYHTLGPEIQNDIGSNIDYLVCGASTGGTISGVGRYLKEISMNTKIYLSDPIGSILGNYVLNKGSVCRKTAFKSHLLEGVGKDSIPDVFDTYYRLIDDVIYINDCDAIQFCHYLTKNEGIFPGGSGGMNVYSALQIAKGIREDYKDVNIVTIVPDGGFKYLSKYYNEEWCKANGIHIGRELKGDRMKMN